jgi:Domain of unknown function (DUF6468)
MSTNMLGMAIEALVAVLLVTTIAYCWLLNSRLTRLRADEKALKTTVMELMGATDAAERAIAGLREMVSECDRTLSHRLVAADQASIDIASQIRAGETILNRIALITEAARRQQALSRDPPMREPAYPPPPAHAPMAFAIGDPRSNAHAEEPRSTTARSAAAVADALVQRARLRSRGEAA